jgi:hypothetical protein
MDPKEWFLVTSLTIISSILPYLSWDVGAVDHFQVRQQFFHFYILLFILFFNKINNGEEWSYGEQENDKYNK